MKTSMKRLAAAALIIGTSSAVLAAGDQGAAGDTTANLGYPAYMGGPGMMGMMGPGMMGPGMMGGTVADTDEWLSNVKQDLGIKPSQQDAWKAYRQAVVNQYALMNAHRQSMWSGGTPLANQTWEQMHQQGWQTRQQMVEAANDLYRTLTPEQQSKASGLLVNQRGWGWAR
jgi:Spy/CpxP family protein refolding chaperone